MSCHDAGGRRRYEDSEFTLRVYPGALSEGTIYCPVSARKVTSAAEVIERVIERLQLDRARLYVLAEVKEFGGEEWILNPCDCPVQRMMLWPRMALENRLAGEDYRFLLREKDLDGSIRYGNLQMWLRVTEGRRRMVERGLLPQPPYVDDLCALPDLNERTLLENLRGRFRQEKIYTYVGGILIVVNPFKFLPIYNPKYVKMYDKQRLGKLEPHIYAVADVAYHAMLQRRRNQCIVISGESGSGKTQSTNFLIHHLTALSQKGFASGVEQIILGAGPVLEAFGNAKTAHNNNSSRFGKFIQVNYQESGTVRGAYVEKYLLEKSRLVYQEHNERNYHVFYYLLAGASEEERKAFHLLKPEEYHYLNQVHVLCSAQDCFTVEGEDLKHDFERLQLAMEMVGFLPTTRKQIFSLLSAILLLGNIRYKKKTYRDDSIDICNPEVLPIISELLEVKEEMLFEALTTRKTVTVGERLIVPYKLAEVRWLLQLFTYYVHVCVFQILSIGVLDIFGFEDYENNSFEQFCINFANETLQHYFNQHVFKLEQEEYRSEGISWHMIDYIDNTACINLISKKPTALLHLLDEECNFPQASNQTLLDKFKRQHEGNGYIEFPAVMEPAFIIRHYAGKVKYSVKDFREKNTDHMRPDIVALLKSSRNAFICGLMGIDPVATFRWAVIRAYFRALVAFREAGKRHKEKMTTTSGEKHVDSFSFLHHPVHQRSLEILQRCKDDKYNSSISRRSPRTPLSDLQGTNTRRENMSRYKPLKHSLHISNGTMMQGCQNVDPACRCRAEMSAVCLQHLLDVRSLKYLSGLTLHDRITKSLLHLHKKKKPPSISAQFNVSLNKLMETLGQSEPYFVKCIRSNAEKLPLRFSDVLVLRQLRYSGMLETVRIRRSGYSVKYSFQDFAHHFRVLLPAGFHTSQTGIRQFLQGVDLEPNGHQVGRSTVFLRERLRQRLQEQLHQEVLRRIVCLQRSFRTQQERRPIQHFISSKHNQCCVCFCAQRWWGACLTRADADLQQGAALRLQAAWRGFRERRLFLRRRRAALIIQTRWRRVLQTRHSAARLIQSVWRSLRQRHSFLQQRRAAVTLQAACRGQRERHRLVNTYTNFMSLLDESVINVCCFFPRCRILREQRRGEKSLCENTVSKSLHAQQNPPEVQEEKGETQSAEPLRSVDDSTLKSRSKRQSRRQRELQQATFSLELLKVRSASVDDALPAQSPLSRHLPSESQGSFELLGCPDEEPTAPEPKPMEENQSSLASFKPHFYIADEDSSPLKQAREKKESVVVIIRMQKEMPVDQSSLEALQKHETMDCMKIWSFIQTTFPNRVRGKMRFWSKSKRDDKKMSTRGRSADSELTVFCLADSPLGSPEQAGLSERGHDSKENREPMMSMMSMKRRRSVKISSVSLESSAWQNDSLHILTSTADYRSMNDFLMKKISDLEAEDSQKDTPVDVVFKKALKEFRLNIFNSYSTALAMDDGRSIRYKDLYALFEHILEKNMRLEQRDWSESPVKVWVNTFKVFLDEFMTEYKPMNGTITKAPKPERKKRRKKESDTVEEHMGHIFKSTQYSIPTYCEFCSSLIWIMDKACVCKRAFSSFDPELSSRQFGVELSRLTSDERAVPLVVEKLINYIEMHGLYTEGIYRKSGSTNKIKELKQGLDTDANSVNLDDYNIHVIASVLKQWLRDLPNPLMTFELYEEFLRAMGLQDKSEVVQGVYSVIDQLSRTHLSTLERLIFHLVRISFQEETNRMSANALAIVFAPCILRCPDTTDPLQSVRDIGKTTACVELVICEQMRKYKARLKDINTLEFAENKAKSRLTHIRRSLGKARLRKSGRHTPSPPLSPRAEREEPGEEGAEPGLSEQQQAAMQQEENVLTQQIENLQKEKEELTYEMLALDPRASDDEMLESEASIGTADSSENLMESEGAASDQWEKSPGASSATRWRKSESKSRRGLRRQPESLDSVDSVSSTPHYRFRSSSSGPLFSAASPGDLHILPDQEGSAQASLTTRCASSSEKTHPRPRGNRSCPPKPREPGEGGSGGSRRREHDFSSSQPLVLYGSNEFMV
uniref:Unconventional myosin-IXa-like n=1 Tax=Sinocyclocheilus anshuiensis TaxID=1608454 RepID=A0A671MWP1_9TELE